MHLPSIETLYPYIFHLIRVVVILAIALILSRISGRVIRSVRTRIVAMMTLRAAEHSDAIEKRASTIGALMRKVVSVLVWTMATIMAVKELGFDVAPLLAGAGVAGLAIGFGAQNLVRDVVSGLFILLENQIRVNDVAVINGTGGLVEQVNLRTIVLRGLDGVVHIFPNGTITTLSNMTMDYSYYVFDMGVAYKEDTDRVVATMQEVSEELRREPEFAAMILEPLEVLGVDKFADSAVIIKARIKTRPIRQWTVGRELNRRFKKKFDEIGIEIPFPHMSLYFGEASKSVQVGFDKDNRAELKAVIREVLAERKA
ncbi:MAG: mechanosensitive ion channel family protein [Acidobacteriota bacterium]